MNEVRNEFDLLDLVLVVAENIKVLILGPLVVGTLVFFAAGFLPKSYLSRSHLLLPASTPTAQQAAAMLTSPLVLDPVIVNLNLANARTDLSVKVKAVVGKDDVLTLDVYGASPEQAQNTANEVLNNFFNAYKPGEQARENLERRLTFSQASLDRINRQIAKRGGDALIEQHNSRNIGEMVTLSATLSDVQSHYVAEVSNISMALLGLSRDIIKKSPSLPAEPVRSKRGMFSVLAALIAAVTFLSWIYLRQSWMRACESPKASAKLKRLRATIDSRVGNERDV